MKKIITILIITCTIVFSSLIYSSPLFAFSINVEPTRLFFNLGSGSSETKSVIIKNNGKNDIAISVYARDWEYKGKSKIFLDAGKSKYSLCRWLSVSPANLLLNPGEEKEVNITLSPTSQGGYVGVVFFEASLGTIKKGKVRIAGRIGTLVFLETKEGVTKKARLTQIKTIQTKERKIKASLCLLNEGNTHIFSNGTIVIIDDQGNVLDKVKFQDWGALPGIKSELTNVFNKELLPGRYILIATVDYGGEEPIVLEKSLTVQ